MYARENWKEYSNRQRRQTFKHNNPHYSLDFYPWLQYRQVKWMPVIKK
jgi:hypothetical protein